MKGTDLTSLLQEQVVFGGTDGTRISLSGPLVKLEARVAVQLALVLHELATNARKYGALSVESGALTIDWSLSSAEEPELRICWTEGGAPEPAPGATAGFGTMLIQRTMEATGGTAIIGYRQDGLFCEIRLKLGDAKYDTPAEAALFRFNERIEARAPRTHLDPASRNAV
jgi:two-component sensor histidine kinase